MKTLKDSVKRTPLIREIFLFFLRIWSSAGYVIGPLGQWVGWLFRSKEFANFTYDLTNLNRRYLASMVATVTGKPYSEIAAYMAELDNNEDLCKHIQAAIQHSSQRFMADSDVHFGRRIGWYAFVRATQPRIVVETGVDKGMGSCVLTAALMMNEQDGYPGRYYGTDINPEAGYLLSGIYRDYGEILYGDSIASLERLDCTIDLFINDSDHSAAYEEREYQSIAPKLAPQAIVLGDNSHFTDRLLNFALATGRSFLFFHESPLGHWYPGAGIGIAFRRVAR